MWWFVVPILSISVASLISYREESKSHYKLKSKVEEAKKTVGEYREAVAIHLTIRQELYELDLLKTRQYTVSRAKDEADKLLADVCITKDEVSNFIIDVEQKEEILNARINSFLFFVLFFCRKRMFQKLESLKIYKLGLLKRQEELDEEVKYLYRQQEYLDEEIKHLDEKIKYLSSRLSK